MMTSRMNLKTTLYIIIIWYIDVIHIVIYLSFQEHWCMKIFVFTVLTHEIIKVCTKISVNHCFPLFSGMIHNWTEFFVEVVCCKYKLGKYKTKDILTNNSSDTAPVSLTDNASSHIPNVNLFPSTPSWPCTNTTRICLDDDHFKIYIYF